MFTHAWQGIRAATAAVMMALCLWFWSQGIPHYYIMVFQLPSGVNNWHGVDLLSAPDSVILAVDSAGNLWLNGSPSDSGKAGPGLEAIFSRRADRVAFLRIADNRSYQELIDLADRARTGGARVLVLLER